MKSYHHKPRVTVPELLAVAPFETETLANGLKLHLIDCSTRPVVRLSIAVHAGTSWQQHPFVATSAANLLGEGSNRLTAQQIAEQLDFVGSFYDVSVDRDWAVVTVCCLTKFLKPTLDIASEILFHPSYPASELDTYRTKRREELLLNRSKVGFVAREELSKALYGVDHPYGISSPDEAYESLDRDEVIDFYHTCYTASNSFAVVSGNISTQTRQQIVEFLEQMPDSKSLPERTIAQPCGTGSHHTSFEGAVQCAVRIGRVMFDRSAPDYIGMQVLTSVLGGYFGSRLVANLRERNGYTYGVWSAMVNFDRSGYMAIATEVRGDAAQDAVEQIFNEIKRLQTEPVGYDELETVKNVMSGEVMRILDGPFGIADVAIENIQNGTTNSYTTDFVDQLRNTTPQQVQQLAQQYFDRNDFTVVTVG